LLTCPAAFEAILNKMHTIGRICRAMSGNCAKSAIRAKQPGLLATHLNFISPENRFSGMMFLSLDYRLSGLIPRIRYVY
jgi:hypothetical protein